MVSATVRSLPGYLLAISASTSAGVVLGDSLGDVLDEGDEQVALGAEVGLAVDLDHDADAVFAPRRHRPYPRRRCGQPSSRPWPDPSRADTRRPCPCRRRHSVSAFLQSIIPTLGHLAQGLYISSSKRSHFKFLHFSISKVKRGRDTPCPVALRGFSRTAITQRLVLGSLFGLLALTALDHRRWP